MSKNLKNTEEQHDRFIEAARALGCDEDEATFTEKLKVIASHKPAPKAAADKLAKAKQEPKLLKQEKNA